MGTKPIRIGEWTLNEVREIGKDIGSPADDTIMRHIVAEYKRMKGEIKLLKKELDECRAEKNESSKK